MISAPPIDRQIPGLIASPSCEFLVTPGWDCGISTPSPIFLVRMVAE